ncbi:TRAP transporter small permease subunit [Sessilibacter corallicola]|uniref:TRAP transporter small permease protein n=1 Tax=Sessilibacter corallicola TaxID=2904075 RepID=A0ABQ0A743_9GAMM|nr:TRAP transporter small permease subunit [Sessilibacter corallicola]MCE2028428.1 TRAP transporter small permease subunit [Sessilibacter corallicola]
MLVKAEQMLNGFSELLGKISAILFVLMLINVFVDVVMRYVFNDVSIGMQEMEWHLFSSMFMLGVPYTLTAGGHVRVDLVYERMSNKIQCWIDIFGGLILLIPFCALVGYYGVGFAREAFELGEGSGDPGGLPYRWIIKAVIPFAFFATAIAGLGLILGRINELRNNKNHNNPQVTL